MEPQPHRRTRRSATVHPLIRNLLLVALGCILGGALATSSLASAHPTAAQPRTSSSSVPATETDKLRESAIAKVGPSVVEVKGDQGLGSGVILTKNGYIVTNNHVVSGQQQLTVRLSDGKNLPAKLIGVDTVDDLAVVKINANNLPPATLGNSGDLRVGQSLLAIGNPLGIVSTVTDGIVSALHRSVSEGQQTNGRILNAIQTSAAINPGNSGGALINLAGQVIGIPTLTAVDPEFNAPAAGVGFAIPSSTVKNITSQIMKYGKVMHSGIAALGIQAYPQSITPSIARQNNLPVDHGVLIRQVESNGPAAKAGIHANDIVVKIDSTTITSYEDMLGALAQHKPGDTIDVTVVTPQRQQHTYKVKLGELNVNNG